MSSACKPPASTFRNLTVLNTHSPPITSANSVISTRRSLAKVFTPYPTVTAMAKKASADIPDSKA
ncbi:hypothetical protein D3C71_1511070 [compost metagenome]